MQILEDTGVGLDALVRWKLSPVDWVREDLGAIPEPWQVEALEAYGEWDIARFRLACMACAGVGKSAVMSWIGLHFETFEGDPDNHVFPQGAAVSITDDNLHDGLWKEMGLWMDRSTVSSRLLQKNNDRIFVPQYRDRWFMSARTFPKTADEQTLGATLSGLHAPKLMYLIDESGAMPVPVGRAAEQGMKQSDALRVAIITSGNPISRACLLYELAIRQAHRYHVISITADPDDPNRCTRVDAAEAAEEIRQRGRDDPWVMAYILGKFPPGEFNALISEDEVWEAMTRQPEPTGVELMPCVLGVDVADEGGDRSVIFPRQGDRAYQPVILHHARGVEGAAAISRLYRELDVDATFIDGGGGYASSWRDQCQALNIPLRQVYFGSTKTDGNPREYANRASQNYYRMAEWIKNGGCLPHLPDLVPELALRTHAFGANGFQIEKKDLMRPKLKGRSPDLADALSLTFDAYLPPRRMARFAGETDFARMVTDPLEGV